MTNKARTTIAALATALVLGAMSAAGALTHSHATSVAAISHGRPAAISAPRAIPFPPETESITND
jgi:hypothetical protein